MASVRRRRHRRERRRARVKKLTLTRYMIRCHDEQGGDQNHWVWITSKGDIIFRDHKNLNLHAMAAHGSLMRDPDGCYWAALRLTTDMWKYDASDYRKLTPPSRDKLVFSDSLCKHVETITGTRAKRKGVAVRSAESVIRPLPETLVYRRDLLSARFAYRVHSMALSIQRRVARYSANPDLGEARQAFNANTLNRTGRFKDSTIDGATDAQQSCWDY